MTQVILFTHDIQDHELLKSSLAVPYVTVDAGYMNVSTTDASDLIDAGPQAPPLPFADAKSALPMIKTIDLSETDTVGILYENTSGLIHNLSDLVGGLVEKSATIKIIDLLTCNLNRDDDIDKIKELEATHGVTIRYSVDLTGHPDSMGNWLLESHGVEVKDIYFNEKIDNWKHVLHVGNFYEANFLDVVATATDENNSTFTPLAGGQRLGGGSWSNDTITAVTFKPGITTIGNNAFFSCEKLKSVTIPDSVVAINPYAFYGTNALETLDFGSNLQSIGEGAFRLGSTAAAAESPTINEVIINFNNVNGVIEDGVIGGIAFMFRKIGNLTIKNLGTGTYTIGEGAFSAATIGDLTLGNGLTSISDQSFLQSQITNITINSDKPYTIGRYAFGYNNALETLELGSNLQSIGTGAFRLGDAAAAAESPTINEVIINFNNVNGVIEDGVIGGLAFMFRKIGNLTIKNLGTGTYTIGDYAFGYATIGDLTLGNGLTSISDQSFLQSQITNITINSDSQTPYTIGEYAFYGNNELTTVNFGSNLQYIGKSAFAINHNTVNNLDALTIDTTYPALIGEGAFSFRAIRTITLEGIKSIGPGAFQYIFGSTTPTAPASGIQPTLTIDFNNSEDGVIGNGAFQSTYFDTVTITNSGAGAYTFDGETFYGAIIGDLTLGNGLTSIPYYTFGLAQITNITINSDKPYTIGEYAFYGNNELTTVNFGSNLQYIGKSAFAINHNTVNNLDALTITYPTLSLSGNVYARYNVAWAQKELDGNGRPIYYDNTTKRHHLYHRVMPNYTSSDGQPWQGWVISEMDRGLTNTSDTYHPDDVWSAIESDAMTPPSGMWETADSSGNWNNEQLTFEPTEITYPITIGESAFSFRAIRIITLEGIKSIGPTAFQYIFGSTTPTAPGTPTALTIDFNNSEDSVIGNGAFQSTYFDTVTITNSGAGAYTFDGQPFYGAIIGDLTLGNGLTSISDQSFLQSQITNITINSDKPYTIGRYAFGYNNALETLDFGSNLQSIGEGAFEISNNAENKLDALTIDTAYPALIGNIAFKNRPIRTITLKGIKSIDEFAFAYIFSIVTNPLVTKVAAEAALASLPPTWPTLTIDFNNSEEGVIGAGAFSFAYFDTVTITNSGGGTYTIGENAFSYCRINALYLQDGLTSIGATAFHTNIENDWFKGIAILDISDQTSPYEIGAGAFYDQKRIYWLRLGSGITKIGEGAFSMTAPSLGQTWGFNAVDATGQHADSGRVKMGPSEDSLKFICAPIVSNVNITFNAPHAVIEQHAFAHRDFKYIVRIENIAGTYTIGAVAFQRCYISSLLLTDGLVEIGDQAFGALQGEVQKYYVRTDNSRAYSRYRPGVRGLYIYDQSQQYTIGEYAFTENEYLKYVVFGGNLQSIGKGAFSDAYLQNVVFARDTVILDSMIGGSGDEFAFSNTLLTVDKLIDGTNVTGRIITIGTTHVLPSWVKARTDSFTHIKLSDDYVPATVGGVGGVVDMSSFYLVGANLSGLNLKDLNLTGSWFLDVDLAGADLSGADLTDAYLRGVVAGPLAPNSKSPTVLPTDYIFADGTSQKWIMGPYAVLSGAVLAGADLTGADLTGAVLTKSVTGPLVHDKTPAGLPDGYKVVTGTIETWLVGPDVVLSGADLTGADLIGADLSGAVTGPLVPDKTPAGLPDGYKVVTGTIETWLVGPGVVLTGADLTGADLTNADLTDAVLTNSVTGPLAPNKTPAGLPTNYKVLTGDTGETWLVGPGAVLTNADLTNVVLTGADLTGADLSSSVLTGATGVHIIIDELAKLPPGYAVIFGSIVNSTNLPDGVHFPPVTANNQIIIGYPLMHKIGSINSTYNNTVHVNCNISDISDIDKTSITNKMSFLNCLTSSTSLRDIHIMTDNIDMQNGNSIIGQVIVNKRSPAYTINIATDTNINGTVFVGCKFIGNSRETLAKSKVALLNCTFA